MPTYLGWKAYLYKLWPSIRYGLGVMTNDSDVLEHLFDKIDYSMMNIFGVASTIKKGFRKLHSMFGGIGLFRLEDEQLIERLNLLLQHYMTGSTISKRLSTTLAYLQL